MIHRYRAALAAAIMLLLPVVTACDGKTDAVNAAPTPTVTTASATPAPSPTIEPLDYQTMMRCDKTLLAYKIWKGKQPQGAKGYVGLDELRVTSIRLRARAFYNAIEFDSGNTGQELASAIRIYVSALELSTIGPGDTVDTSTAGRLAGYSTDIEVAHDAVRKAIHCNAADGGSGRE